VSAGKKRVGELVGGLDPFNQEVLRLLLQEYDFTGMSLDQAMRVRRPHE
jgi:Sec7-like guanine-nucleotide exchange factor